MKKTISAIAVSLLVFGSQGVMAGKCDPDPESPMQLTTTQMYFDPATTLQTVTVTNDSLDDLTLSTSITGNTSWFVQSLNCDGATLFPGTHCTITVNFYPDVGGENRQYKKRMVITGTSHSGEYDQTVCLDGTN